MRCDWVRRKTDFNQHIIKPSSSCGLCGFPLYTCRLFDCFGCALLRDQDSYVCIRRPDHDRLHERKTHQRWTREQRTSIVFISVSVTWPENDRSRRQHPPPGFLQCHCNVMYIMMMASGMYKSVKTNCQAKCILFLGWFWLVKSISRYWFLTQILFCTFFKFKVCIFIFFLHIDFLPRGYNVAVLVM